MNNKKSKLASGVLSTISYAAAALIFAVSCSDAEPETRLTKAQADASQESKTETTQTPNQDATGDVARTTANSEIDGYVDALDPDMYPVGGNTTPAAGTTGGTTTATPTPSVPPPNESTKTWAPDPVGTEEHVILDFEMDTVPDSAWRSKQPAGKVVTYVGPKGDSGNDKLYLAKGEGRNGSTALVVEAYVVDPNVVPVKTTGLPGFWVLRGTPTGNATSWDGYLLPKGKRANQIEFWVRFDAGFRQKYTSNPVIGYPNHQNFHLGTYNYDPAKIGTGPVKETGNWHFYHQIYLRHDKAQAGWIKVVINESPSHQRGYGGMPGVNPTAPFGNYFEIMTRFYLDCDKYFADPEIQYPLKMYVDDIKFKYVPPTKDIVVAFDGLNNGAGFQATVGVVNKVPFTITNNEATSEAVRMNHSGQDGLNNRSIVDAAGNAVPANFTLAPKSSKKLFLVFTAGGPFQNRDVGVNLILQSQIKEDKNSSYRSMADDNVEKRWQPEAGPTDGEPKSAFLNVMAQ